MSHAATDGRVLYVRHAKKDSRSVAILRAVDNGASCVVEAQVFSAADGAARQTGPYTFPDSRQATAFVTEAVEALMYLGCEVFAQ